MLLQKWIHKLQKRSIILQAICIMMTLIIVLTSCSPSVVPTQKALPPKPTLEHGWLPEADLMVKGQSIKGHCMINDDAKKLMMYIDLIEFRQAMP
ncbi:MAG: hypothetical protein HQK93_07225 [Nitrospirae bacterium]|nr:hypothetical protein [Nitrospirota bacterium]